MKFLGRTTGHTRFDIKRNEEMLEELNLERVDQKLRRYKSHWLRHATRMNNNRTPKYAFLCHLLYSFEIIMLLFSIVFGMHIYFSCSFLPKTNDTQNNEAY